MNISLNWLTDYVDVGIPVSELAALLTRIGLETDLEAIRETDTDIVMDVEVTSNRSDCLGHIGVAREVAAALGVPLKLPDLSNIPTIGDVAEHTGVQVLSPDFCPRYTARLIRNVKVCPSPRWLVERLEAVGLRGINNVVDATNYVMMEYSQPLHAFDFDKLSGRRIVVRRAADGERLVSIDGTKCDLRSWMGVIADAERPVAIAGVMGGLDTEVSDQTVNVLMEAARFDPLSIRKTSRHLNLMSESSYRFERGVDPVALERASLRACQLILQTGGGELLGGICDAWAEPFTPAEVSLRPARVSRLLGVDVPRETQVALLGTLGLQPTDEGETIRCAVPPHRPDLSREVDLIEEVARLYGLDNIPTGGRVSHEVHPAPRMRQARQAVAQVLNAAGYYEAITFTFLDAEESELFGWTGSPMADKRTRKTNNVLRQGLLPSLLRVRKTNQDGGVDNVRLYELAEVFPPGSGEQGKSILPDEHTQIGLICDGETIELRGVLEVLVRRFDPAAELLVEPADVAGFAAGSAARLSVMATGETQPFGVMGVVVDNVRDYYGLTKAPAGAMVRFGVPLSLGMGARQYKPLPKFPAIGRDLSLVVDEAVSWQALVETIRWAAGDLCVGVEYVGAYRGKQVGKGRKSVTLRLVYRHEERTLRHEEVDAATGPLVEALKSKHNAELRS